MLVSHRHRFIFVKTRKSAGSSVELAFEPFARPEGWTPAGGEWGFATEEMVTDAGIVGARSREAKEGATYFDHMPARQIRKRVGDRVWKKYFKFCTLRNPWDKTVSFFHFTNKRLRDEPKDVLIARFRHWATRPVPRHGPDQMIYWINKKPAMDGFIRYHHLAEDTAAIADYLGVGPVNIGGIHTEFRNRDMDYQDYYDDASREAIARTYADEIAHFGWVFDNSVEPHLPRLPARVA